MAKCGDCLHFRNCSHYVTAEETFTEIGGCSAFKSKENFVEVVRCKDCDFAYEGSYGLVCAAWGARTDYDMFCGKGERREGE